MSKTELVKQPPSAAPACEGQDDWPARRPLHDPVLANAAPEDQLPPSLTNQQQAPAKKSYVKEEVFPTPTAQRIVGLSQPQQAMHIPAAQSWNRQSQPSEGLRMQPQSLPPAGTPHFQDTTYFGPRPLIRNFSRQDPIEYVHLAT